MEVNKTIYGNNGDVPDKLLDIFLLSSTGIRNHMNWQVVSPDPEFPQSYRTIQCDPTSSIFPGHTAYNVNHL